VDHRDDAYSPLQEATPLPGWDPPGSWSLQHGPGVDALWATGEGRSDRPCGIETAKAGNRGTVSPLCAVHGMREPGGDWVGWAVGEQGMLARYRGGAWEAVDDLAPRNTSPLTYHLHDVYVIGAEDVWAVGWVEGDRSCQGADCGMVLHYDGSSWEMQPRTPMGIFACMERLNAIDMQYDPEFGWYGWAVGDDTDCQSGGAVYLGLNYDLDKPDIWRWFRVPQASRNMHDVKIVARNDVWAVGDFGIESHFYKPENSPSWSVYGKSGADDRYSIDLADPLYGWNAGIRGRLNRYMGACHDEDPGTQCWFDNQASPIQDLAGNKVLNSVYAIDLIDRDRGWLVGEEDGRRSMIAHFEENKRWRSDSIEGDPGKSLYGLHVIDESWAIAVGDEGTILEYRAVAVTPATPTEPATATESPTPTEAATGSPTASATDEPSATPGTPSPAPSPATATSPVPTPDDPTATPEPSATTPTPEPSATTPTRLPSATPSRDPCDCRIYTPFLLKRR
jgi:hypothetical protein